jgi:hypothetical protein
VTEKESEKNQGKYSRKSVSAIKKQSKKESREILQARMKLKSSKIVPREIFPG